MVAYHPHISQLIFVKSQKATNEQVAKAVQEAEMFLLQTMKIMMMDSIFTEEGINMTGKFNQKIKACTEGNYKKRRN